MRSLPPAKIIGGLAYRAGSDATFRFAACGNPHSFLVRGWEPESRSVGYQFRSFMSDHPLPAELLDFLAMHVDSVAQLEALLLLRQQPNLRWDAKSVAGRLYVDEQDALEALTHLASQGCLTREAGGFGFEPQSDHLAQMVALLAECYRTHLIPITNYIHAKPRRIRQFADAFKLKRD